MTPERLKEWERAALKGALAPPDVVHALIAVVRRLQAASCARCGADTALCPRCKRDELGGVPRCKACGCAATAHEVDDEELRECGACPCRQFEAMP